MSLSVKTPSGSSTNELSVGVWISTGLSWTWFSYVAAHHSCHCGCIKSCSNPYLPPAYIVRREGNVFTSVCPQEKGGGTPASGSRSLLQLLVPGPLLGWGRRRVLRQRYLSVTCAVQGGTPLPAPSPQPGPGYTADGTPLAVTQEDVLVLFYVV